MRAIEIRARTCVCVGQRTRARLFFWQILFRKIYISMVEAAMQNTTSIAMPFGASGTSSKK